MLSESSYLTALYVYIGAACAILVLLAWSLRRRWRGGPAALLVLLAAVLLLTPAFPKAGVDTLAPALIVAGFQLFTDGYPAAEHALRPLAFMAALAVGIALLLRLTLLRRPRVADTSPDKSADPA